MSAENVENSTMVSNRETSLEVSSPPTCEVAERSQSADIFSILNRMNESITQSNQLLVQVVRGQGKHGRAPCTSDSDSDIGDFNEPPSKKKRLSSVAEDGNMPRIYQDFPPAVIHNAPTASQSVANSPAPAIAGHNTETRPSADDVVSLFGEQDIEEEANATKIDTASQDQFLTEVENAVATAKNTGPPISEHLAGIINKKFHLELEPAQRKALIDKYLVPENCSGLYRPRVNHEIWNSLRSSSKIADKSVTMLQDALITASSAIVTSIEDLLKGREMKTPLDFQTVVSRQIDAITLLGFISSELSYRRKEALRPSIAPEYKSACSRTTKPTTLLFGDDLSKVMQEVRTTSRLLSNNFSATRPQRRGGNQRLNFDANQNNSFLLQKGRMAYPPRRNPPYFAQKKRSSKNWKM